MPAAAYTIIGLFVVVSVLVGLIAAWSLGPRHWWSPALPALGAFGSLYVVGHRLSFGFGPTVEVAGFDIWIASDVLVALAAAFVVAALQVAVARLLQPQQRSAGRDSLT